MSTFFADIEAFVAAIPDGARLAIPPDYSGVALAATRALVRRNIRGLHLIAVPQAGLQADVLIGAGCVATLEAAGINLGEHGLAPRFTAAVLAGSIVMRDAHVPGHPRGTPSRREGHSLPPPTGHFGFRSFTRASRLAGHRQPVWAQ